MLTGPAAIVGLERSLHRCAPVGRPAVEGRRGTGKRPFRSRCASVEHGARPNHERRGPPASHQPHPTGGLTAAISNISYPDLLIHSSHRPICLPVASWRVRTAPMSSDRPHREKRVPPARTRAMGGICAHPDTQCYVPPPAGKVEKASRDHRSPTRSFSTTDSTTVDM